MPSLQTRWTIGEFKRTAVSNSIAENKKPPSPDTETTFLPGSTKVAAIAQGSATPSVCIPLLNNNLRGS